MNIDTKHDLLKNFVTEQKLGQKNVQANIDQSMVASPEQKSMGDLQNGSTENQDQKKKKQKLGQTKKSLASSSEDNLDSLSAKIERDPLKLLKVLW